MVPERLEGKRVALLFVGPVDAGTAFAVRKAVVDAGGTIVRTRSIRAPLDTERVQDVLKRQPAFRRLQGVAQLEELGGALAERVRGR